MVTSMPVVSTAEGAALLAQQQVQQPAGSLPTQAVLLMHSVLDQHACSHRLTCLR